MSLLLRVCWRSNSKHQCACKQNSRQSKRFISVYFTSYCLPHEESRGLGILELSKVLYAKKLMSSPSAKKLCTMAKIGTHNGTFHCDEVLACFLLKQLPKYKDAEIIRTRDQTLLDSCDIVVDVGGVYDPAKNRYDHHQRTFNESMSTIKSGKPWTTKLSSAGLIYLHFGQEVIAKILETTTDDSFTQRVYDKVYEMFVEEVDAIDNGISQAEGKPRYAVTTTLSSRVSHLNPRWNEPSTDDDSMMRFRKAMELVGTEFKDRVEYYSTTWWPARKIVEDALEKRTEVDASGQILSFTQGGCPWKDHLFTLEEEKGLGDHIKFVLYPDQNNKWRVQCVPVHLSSFENRLSLLEEWRGIRDQALSDLSGIEGCVFVHASGFIGGNETYEGALEMARKTLQYQNKGDGK